MHAHSATSQTLILCQGIKRGANRALTHRSQGVMAVGLRVIYVTVSLMIHFGHNTAVPYYIYADSLQVVT